MLLIAAYFFVGKNDGALPSLSSVTPAAPPDGQQAPKLMMPVVGVKRAALVDSWHDARAEGARRHEAIDIAAASGTPVVAAMAGTVEKLFVSKAGGNTIYVRSTDRKWISYYAHLLRYARGLAEGQAIKQGTEIGYVGDTGNAGQGNNHLHFALHRMQPDEPWHKGTPINPYPVLAAKGPVR